MFRSAILRSAVAASRVARPVAARSARSAFIIPRAAAPTSRIAAIPAVRMYSAASGLKKEEVESRIMGILTGFDKVNDPSNEFSIEIPDKDADGIHSVNQAVDYILSQPDAN
ncbi:hypothetical protein E0Z10_g3943 [Xylaria hypoxylon]|uniref:Acyl carrier protein n=1 Tax=Xylaria hypoxylon TaxID=37992 RepID=A0A4Z0YZB0_9PEZI|nr:hypothetical protein E0Z10_g3943 [Xylaria hypoxylon]